LTAIVLVGGGLAGYYYLPGFLEAKVDSALTSPDAVPVKLLADPIALAKLQTKIDAFTKIAESTEAVDVTLSLTEKELNAWMVDQLAKARTPVRLVRASVRLDQGMVEARATARGHDIAALIPAGTFADYFKGALAKADYVDLSVTTGLLVRDGKLSLSVRGARVGTLSVPLALANPVIERLIAGQTVTVAGLTLSDVAVEPGKLVLRGIRGTGREGAVNGDLR